MATREIGIFALGTVLAPGELLPLHIFEERYKQLIGDCLETGGRFLLLYTDEDGTRELGCAAAVVEVLRALRRRPHEHRGRGRRAAAGGRDDPRPAVHHRRWSRTCADDTAGRRGARRRVCSSTARFAAASGLETEDDDLEADERPLSYAIMARVDFPAAEKQRILEMRTERDRLMALVELLGRGLQALQQVEEIRKRAQTNGKVPALGDDRRGGRRARSPDRHPLAALVARQPGVRRRVPRQPVALRELGPADADRVSVPARRAAAGAARRARAAADHARARRCACWPSPRSGCGCRWC